MRLTVVIPTLDVATYIEKAVESVLTQTYPPLELIIVDNGSSDGTIEIIGKLKQQYPDRIALFHEKRPGAPYARNTGWLAGKGEWVQFLDADDYLLPNKLERQLKLAHQTNADVIIGTPIYENLQAEQTALVPWSDPWKGLAHGMYCGQTSANLYRRSALESIAGWDEKLPDTQDTDLMLRLLINTAKWQIDEEPSCVCRDRPAGKITQKDPKGILLRHLRLRERLHTFLATEKEAYWQKNESFFYLATYRLIRMLAIQDAGLASRLYEECIPPDFQLVPNQLLKVPAWNAFMVNHLGLEKTEWLKNRFRFLFSEQRWQNLKERLS